MNFFMLQTTHIFVNYLFERVYLYHTVKEFLIKQTAGDCDYFPTSPKFIMVDPYYVIYHAAKQSSFLRYNQVSKLIYNTFQRYLYLK
jgi:hypothetical protein